MFTVRAEIDPRDGSGVRNAFLISANTIIVHRNNDRRTSSDHQWRVELYDQSGKNVRDLEIGTEIDHYCAVFVMNEQGKTVDRVMATYSPQAVAA